MTPVAHDVRRMAVGRQRCLDRAGDGSLVLDDQDPQGVVLRSTPPCTAGRDLADRSRI
jgi:hypothetical protein